MYMGDHLRTTGTQQAKLFEIADRTKAKMKILGMSDAEQDFAINELAMISLETNWNIHKMVQDFDFSKENIQRIKDAVAKKEATDAEK